MSDHIQVPMTHLHEIATKFASMKTELDGTEQSATELHGVDANDGHLVATAVTDFLSEWKQSRRFLLFPGKCRIDRWIRSFNCER